MTGSTQGIRFKIKPPRKAKIIAVNNEIPVFISAEIVDGISATS